MGLVSQVIPGLWGGVSQQPQGVRKSTQCEIQDNGLGTVADGLMKRPPTAFEAILTQSGFAAKSKIHFIKRDANERYVVVFQDSDVWPVRVFNLDGSECTVQYGQLDEDNNFTADATVKDYLSSADPVANYRALTIADHTFVTNQEKACKMKSSGATAQTDWYCLWVKRAIADQTYKVFVNGINTGTVSTGTTPDTGSICTSLEANLQAHLGVTATFHRVDNMLFFRKNDGSSMNLRAYDGYDGLAMSISKNVVTKLSDLPEEHYTDGYVYKVAGEESPLGHYYLKWNATDRLWEETVAPGLINEMDPDTLPHRLVRTGVDEFTFAPCLWGKRTVGDEESAPNPSFITQDIAYPQCITDILLHRGRLTFLSGENVCMSKANGFFQFYPDSVMDLLDSDPIDITVDSVQVSALLYGIPRRDTLLLFSEKHQFQLGGGSTLTPKNVVIDTVTRFEAEPLCAPTVAGPNVYFASPKGNTTAIREFFVQPETLVEDAADVTGHVPTYLPPNIRQLLALPAHDTIFAIPRDNDGYIYVYRYLWNGEEKPQSAWMRWKFDADIIGAETIDQKLYLLTQRGNEVCLESIDIENFPTGTLPFRVHLDRLIEVQGTYDNVADETTWAVPYSTTGLDVVVVEDSTGHSVDDATSSGLSMKAPGNHTGTTHHIGVRYEMLFRFSEFHVDSPETNVDILKGRLQMRTMTLSTEDTGYFQTVVTPPKRDPMTREHTMVTTGVALLGRPSIASKTIRFMTPGHARGMTVDIKSDSYLPCRFTHAAWEGTYVSLSRSL